MHTAPFPSTLCCASVSEGLHGRRGPDLGRKAANPHQQEMAVGVEVLAAAMAAAVAVQENHEQVNKQGQQKTEPKRRHSAQTLLTGTAPWRRQPVTRLQASACTRRSQRSGRLHFRTQNQGTSITS